MPEVERPEFSKDAKPTERSYGKSVGGFRGIVQFWKGWCRARVANDKNIKKRSQHITETAFIDYCFV